MDYIYMALQHLHGEFLCCFTNPYVLVENFHQAWYIYALPLHLGVTCNHAPKLGHCDLLLLGMP